MFKLDRKAPTGTVLLLGISYIGLSDTDPDVSRGITSPKVFTYAALKTGGLWYVTGSGRVPTAAGNVALERWLAAPNRTVEWVHLLTGAERIYVRSA